MATGEQQWQSAAVEEIVQRLASGLGEATAAPAGVIVPIQNPAGNPYWDILSAVLQMPQPKIDHVNVRSWAVCYPGSVRYQDTDLLLQVLEEVDAQWSKDPLSYADINILIFDAARVLDALYQVDCSYPDVIPPTIKARWIAGVQAQLERIYEVRSNPTGNPRRHGTNYPNPDAHTLLAMHLGQKYIADTRYADFEAALLNGLREHLYPDGGWSYLFNSNEEPAYHGVTQRALIRYWEISQSEAAWQIIRDTAPYYPLSVERGGVAEGSSSPYWKHRWDLVLPWFPGAVGAVAGAVATHSQGLDLLAFNAAAGANYLGGVFRELFTDILRMAASWYDPALGYVAAADNYVKYDRNIEGPRGRFGNWSFQATGRDLDRDRGKYTFAGAMIVDPGIGLYPLSAALQIAASRFYSDADGNNFILGMHDNNSQVIGRHFATFSTRYQLQEPIPSGGFSRPLPWNGRQLWIMTPQRVVARIAINADSTQTAHGVEGVIRLGSGRGLPILRAHSARLSRIDDQNFAFARMRVVLHGHNYDSIIMDTKPTDYRGNSADIVLRDAVRSDGSGAASYPLADRPDGHWYLFEAKDKDVPAAVQIHYKQLGNLHTLFLDEGETGQYWVIANHGSAAAELPLDAAHLPAPMQGPLQYFTADGNTAIIAANGGSLILAPAQQITIVSGGAVDWTLRSTGDSIPDAWKVYYFGNTLTSATDDPDGDGYNNLEEFILGTHPLQADPRFSAWLQVEDGQFRIEFPTRRSPWPGIRRRYDILTTTHPGKTGWLVHTADIAATDAIVRFPVTCDPVAFYRVRIRMVDLD